MNFSQEVIDSLRQALVATPENIPLRKHLAELLLHHQQPEAAIQEYRTLLGQQPSDQGIRLGLAESYLKASKLSAAAVMLEDLSALPDAPAKAYALLAHLLCEEGRLDQARERYQQALKIDPSLQEAELDRRLFMQVSSQLQANPETDEPLFRQAVPVGKNEASDDLFEALEIEKPRLSFDQVGGMEAVKAEIQIKLIQPLEHPELFRAYGKEIGGGLLMYGPPGCGKTYLARATAGEVNAAFLSVGINEILDMWLGQSERNLHAIFDEARKLKPCVLFFDEVDALAARRSDMRQSAGRQLINQFLLELDGERYSNEGVLILAATNAPWHLDGAFRRPGRFDQLLFVPPPDEPARIAIFDILLAPRPVEKVDTQVLARKTPGFSGADLKAVVEHAIEDKLREAMKSGQTSPICQKDLLKCIKQAKPTTREWFATARNYALYANQSGFYDDILTYLDQK